MPRLLHTALWDPRLAWHSQRASDGSCSLLPSQVPLHPPARLFLQPGHHPPLRGAGRGRSKGEGTGLTVHPSWQEFPSSESLIWTSPRAARAVSGDTRDGSGS